MGRLVKQCDPTRPIFFESDGDPGRRGRRASASTIRTSIPISPAGPTRPIGCDKPADDPAHVPQRREGVRLEEGQAALPRRVPLDPLARPVVAHRVLRRRGLPRLPPLPQPGQGRGWKMQILGYRHQEVGGHLAVDGHRRRPAGRDQPALRGPPVRLSAASPRIRWTTTRRFYCGRAGHAAAGRVQRRPRTVAARTGVDPFQRRGDRRPRQPEVRDRARGKAVSRNSPPDAPSRASHGGRLAPGGPTPRPPSVRRQPRFCGLCAASVSGGRGEDRTVRYGRQDEQALRGGRDSDCVRDRPAQHPRRARRAGYRRGLAEGGGSGHAGHRPRGAGAGRAASCSTAAAECSCSARTHIPAGCSTRPSPSTTRP